MNKKTLYQTLEDRQNPDEVENNGPFKCKNKKAWLGFGYYFWDSFIENAHWWGENNLSREYIIGKTYFDFNESTCFDLVGNTNHLNDFWEIVQEYRMQGLIDKDTKVVEIISHLKKNKIFNYPSIRVSSTKSDYHSNQYSIKFVDFNKSILELKPLIQICIYDLCATKVAPLVIVHPEHYKNDL